MKFNFKYEVILNAKKKTPGMRYAKDAYDKECPKSFHSQKVILNVNIQFSSKTN